MKILVTGSAGFIGSALTLFLLERGDTVVGIDNHNDYYDVKLKEARINRFIKHKNYFHNRVDLADDVSINEIFQKHKPKIVVNLAAQAGVRYSIQNPNAYISSNIVGFMNILENCRNHEIDHLVYASTSSVYGANTNMPFSENQSANHPLSLYAASKKSNELMAHAYSHLYKIPTTGLRFFTVYGPWGRPDMALFKFTKAILEEKAIDIYNNGNHIRDFTYIDDIVGGVVKAIESPSSENLSWDSFNPEPSTSLAPWTIYNIGNNEPIELLDYINALEKVLNKKAKRNYLPLQKGDVANTHANVSSLIKKFNYKPNTSIEDGVAKFVDWYKSFYVS